VRTLKAIADRGINAAAVLLMLSLLVCVGLGVISRQINRPIAWTDEMAQYLMVWTALTGWIIASRNRVHIRITVLLDRLSARLRQGLEIVIRASVILLGFVMVRYSLPLIERNLDVEWVSLPLSVALLYLPVPITGLAVMLYGVTDLMDVLRFNRASESDARMDHL